jgi:hypothetical protein
LFELTWSPFLPLMGTYRMNDRAWFPKAACNMVAKPFGAVMVT